MPTATNAAPATVFNVLGEAILSSCAPTNTPMPAASTNAAEAAENTSHLFTLASLEKSIVASCVLSPTSARKIVTKTEMNVSQNTVSPPSEGKDHAKSYYARHATGDAQRPR